MTDLADIRLAQRQTADACDRVRLYGSISFGGVVDIGDSLKRLEIGSSLSTTELLRLGRILKCAARAKAFGRQREDRLRLEEDGDTGNRDSLFELFAGLEPLTPLSREIERCILSEEEIADDASPGLKSVRREMHRVRSGKRSLSRVMVWLF